MSREVKVERRQPLSDGLPVVSGATCDAKVATRRCPTGAIQWIEHRQFEEPELPPAPERHYA